MADPTFDRTATSGVRSTLRQPAALDAVPSAPLNAPLCPICGQPNECAASASGRFAAECWCLTFTFSQALLARVPPDLERRACICRRCAEQGNERHSGQGQAR